MGSGGTQPKEATWDLLPVGSPLAGGAKGVGCKEFWVEAEGRDLDCPIPGLRPEHQCNLFWCL